jgi:NAD(P)-dependent dehydrogenase (short-subunit alcohol dehydrogenase family)
MEPLHSNWRAANARDMSLYGKFQRPGPSGYGYSSTSEEVTSTLDLSGKTFVVTGVTSGIGQETVRVLLLRGAQVFGLGRRVEGVRAAFEGAPGLERLRPVALELSDLSSVAEAARVIRAAGVALDALVLNAGVMALPRLELVSGYERQFFTNHIGHYYLGRLLEAALAPLGRVVIVSSDAHRAAPRVGIDFDNLGAEKSYQPWVAYGRSKLANLLFAFELGERLRASGRIAHAVHPGVIDTPLNRHMSLALRALYPVGSLLFMKSIPQGAATQLYVATHPAVPNEQPSYWADSNVRTPRQIALSVELRKKLWEVSSEIVNRLALEKITD